ncbi:protein OS-9 homolog [Physcomitrium patens]|uniref:MRH domain-containing protein n=1 Tax=Physcomitrium patens TaxID=3218 RepID=A0A7I4BVV6_PHYPA|nr:protein OS-9 homolog isoform X2 [Physcomitrium patens]|eukprot:XP_024385684.1 protein OS-9 homolog isoform X2 [Physcomitrella patens]
MAKLVLGVIAFCILTIWAVHADRMRSPQSDVTSSLQDPKYKINFHPAESPILPTSDQEIIVMTDRDGKKFRCNLPVAEGTEAVNKDEIQQTDTSTSIVADEWSARKTPEDLLDILKDKCFRRYEGWWIYELCYKGHLRQFHLHDNKAPICTYGPDMQHGSVVYFFTLVKQPFRVPHDYQNHRKMVVQEFVLGTYDVEATSALHKNSPNVSLRKDLRSESAAQRYHAHVYTNGTICDLTNQPRETEVRFVCSETGRMLINSIKEAPTCKYILVFHTPMLCKHPTFQEERQPWVVIDCNAVPSEMLPMKEGTASEQHPEEATNQAETDTRSKSVISALPENTNEIPLLNLPHKDAILLSRTSTNIEGGTKVKVRKKSTEFKASEEVPTPSNKNQETDEPVADSDDKETVEEQATPTRGEEKTEEQVFPRQEREEKPTS